jgi:hypothetical protein
MRPSLSLGISALLACVTLGATVQAGDKCKGEEGPHYKVEPASGQVTVKPASSCWHINLDYGWTLKKGDDKVKQKSDFSLSATEASVKGVAPGEYTLKGAVCSDDGCNPFTTKVTVN